MDRRPLCVKEGVKCSLAVPHVPEQATNIFRDCCLGIRVRAEVLDAGAVPRSEGKTGGVYVVV